MNKSLDLHAVTRLFFMVGGALPLLFFLEKAQDGLPKESNQFHPGR